MVEEEWSFIRHYTYNPAWRKGKEAFFATDGSDQSMIVMFAPEGCVINGVDSELYDWEEKLPRIEDLTDGMPPALQKLMGSREVKKMKSTFCVWTEDGTTWHCNPMDGEDASKDLLSTIDGNPQSYVDYGKWFYPADLPLEAVRQLADGVPVTKELVAALNPKRSEWEEIKTGLIRSDIQMNFNSQPTGEDSSDQRTHPHLRRSQKQGQAADGVRRMVRRPQCGYFHCGAVLRQSWRPDDEDHSAVLPQVFRPVLRVVLGTEKDELGSGLSICFVSLPGQRDQKPFGGAYFRDMSGCELAEIEQAAGQKCQPIGHIGYYYPAEVWISEYGKLYAKYEYQDEIECFPDVFALIERELRQYKFDSAAMKTVEALDGKL